MSGAQFSKQSRVLTAAQFDKAFASGHAKRQTNGVFVAVIAANDVQRPRIGFAIAKRNAKTAVQRNRIKRKMREAFRLHSAQLSPVDIVVFLRNKAPADRAAEHLGLAGLWKKVHRACVAS